MKVNVKGLAFVGFAAAVFAQSAMAAIILGENDPKTVTSKKYVDDKIPDEYAMTYGGSTHAAESTDGAVVLGNGRGQVKFTKLSNSSNDVHTTNGQDVVVTGKAVADAMAATVNLQGDVEKHTAVEDIEDNGALVGHKVVVPDEAVADTSAKIVNTDSATGTETIHQKDKLTTAGAVYDYTQPKALNSTVYAGKFQVGYRASGSDAATWKVLQEDDTANVTHYVKMAQKDTTGDNANVYNVNLDADQIASYGVTAGGNTNQIVDDSTKLATANAVYEFVTDQNKQWQPKIEDANQNKFMVGYQTYDSNSGVYTNGWKELKASSNGTSSNTNYVTINETATAGVYAVNLDTAQIANTEASIGSDGGVVGSTASALTTAGAVHAYAVRQSWGNGNAGKTLVTDSNGDVTVSNVPRVPDMPPECGTSTSVHCALVTVVDQAASGNTPAVIHLEWTVMAQVD